jgi:hypothetical protein
MMLLLFAKSAIPLKSPAMPASSNFRLFWFAETQMWQSQSNVSADVAPAVASLPAEAQTRR